MAVRGPLGRKEQRIRFILSELRQCKPFDKVRDDCIAEWGISQHTWWRYWSKASQYLKASTTRQANAYKEVILQRLENLLPECTKVDENGVKVDVIQTCRVLKDIRELLGVDAPVKSVVDTTLTTLLEPSKQEALIDAVPAQIESLPEAPNE